MNTPLVSICCITYNHAPFIRQALDGFLMQKCVDFEILIHDDCSTDGTTEIIREYAEKYPDIIKPLYETENQYSKGVWVDGFNYRRAKGKYIAYCEGDDYWTDPLKLQKQVDFMESYPDYSVCFHTFRNHIVQTDEYIEPAPTQLLRDNGNPDGMDITMDMYFRKWYTQPMTMLFRLSSFSFEWQKQYKYYRDMHEIYHLLKAGKCRLLNFDGGVRNMHAGGIASEISQERYCELSLPMDGEFYRLNKHEAGAKRTFMDTLQSAVNVYAVSNKWLAIKCAFKHMWISHYYKTFLKNLKYITTK